MARQLFNSKPSGRALAITGLVCFFLFNSALASAQELPDAPKAKVSHQKIFDLETVTELELVGGSLAADALSTQKLYEFPRAFSGEGNPLARPFVCTRGGTVGWFAGGFALDVYGTYLLRKHHHPWVARVMNLGIVAWESYSALGNYRYINNSNEECGLHHPVTGCVGGVSQ